MNSDLIIWCVIGAVAIVALLYWWFRPLDWRDGEGSGGLPNSYDATDVGSPRWWFFNGTDEGRALSFGLNLRDWWENERRRWRR